MLPQVCLWHHWKLFQICQIQRKTKISDLFNFKMPNISYSLSYFFTASYNLSQLCTAVQTVNCLTQLLLQLHVLIFLFHSIVTQSSKWKDVCLYLWIIDRIEKLSLFQIFSQCPTEWKFSIGKIIWNTNFYFLIWNNDLLAICNYYTIILNNYFRFFYFENVMNYFWKKNYRKTIISDSFTFRMHNVFNRWSCLYNSLYNSAQLGTAMLSCAQLLAHS